MKDEKNSGMVQNEENSRRKESGRYTMREDAESSMVKETMPAYGNWKRQGEYTLEDYYALPDDIRVELIDGVIYDMSSPRTVHQDIAFIIHLALYDYMRKKKKPCKKKPVNLELQRTSGSSVSETISAIYYRLWI